jgi:hypothetical protein
MRAGILSWAKRWVLSAKIAMAFLLRAGRLLQVVAFSIGRNQLRRQNIDPNRPMTLLLSPEAGLEPYFASHLIVADALASEDFPAVILSCNGDLPTCSFKSAVRMPPTAAGDNRNIACRRCRLVRLESQVGYGTKQVAINQLGDEGTRHVVEEILKINAPELWRTQFDGVEFGRICAADVLREQRKLAIEEFGAEEIAVLRALLHSALLLYLVTKKAIDRFRVKQIVYFGDYAQFMPIQFMAKRHQIRLVNLSHGYNLDTDRRLIGFRPGFAIADMQKQIAAWPEFQSQPLAPFQVDEIVQSALYRLGGHGGSTTYSPNWVAGGDNLHEKLGLKRDRLVYVAYLSSNDEVSCIRELMELQGEIYGHSQQPFADQITWVRALVDWFSDRSDLQLILRLHPRMGIGHRHSNVASEYGQFKERFAELPPNVVPVWPEDKLSSYNLAEIADAALISWSSIGLELARFGVPLVAAFRGIGFFPVNGFAQWAPIAKEYFSLIDVACRKPATIESITEAFRWTYYLHRSPTIDVSDIIPSPDYHLVPIRRQTKRSADIIAAVTENACVWMSNMQRQPRGANAYGEERKAILRAAKTILNHFSQPGESADRQANRESALVRRLSSMLLTDHSG